MFYMYKTTRPGPHRGQELLHGNGTTGSPLGTGPSRTEVLGQQYLFGDYVPTKGTELEDFLCPTTPRSTQDLLHDWGPTNVHLFNSTMTFRPLGVLGMKWAQCYESSFLLEELGGAPPQGLFTTPKPFVLT